MTLSTTPRAKPRPDQEIVLTEVDFQNIARFMHKHTGINLTDGNQRMVYARLCRRIADLGLSSFESYVSMLLEPSKVDEREFLISALTTNTTHFFREGYHFDFLKENVFPELRDRARAGERIRIWSSACSTGEEPYSIAIALASFFPDVFDFDVRILATDIDPQVLNQAQRGLYPSANLSQLPREYLDKFFSAGPNSMDMKINENLKSLISFKRLNLIEDWPFRRHFDVIFCRNVAIYMDMETQEKIWTAFHRYLLKGGYLFLGHSERLSASLKNSFKMVANTTYLHLVQPDERAS